MGTAKRRSGRQRASALIVTLGVLTVLALLAFTFSGLSRGERNISRVYVDHVRARILAMSGVEKARSMALAALAIPPSSQLYYSIAEGADPLNGYGAGAPAPAGGQVYSYPSVPVEYARYPSYRVDLTGKPGTVNGFLHIPELDNEFDYRVPPLSPGSKQHLFGASGVLPATYIKNGVPGWDYYAIKIIDGNGRIYVNGEDPVGYAGTPTPLKNNHLRLLNNLGTVMNQSGKLSGSNVNLGTIITNARASKNITTLSEIKPYMNGTQQQKDADFQALSSVLTTYAWVDPSVVNASKIVHPRADDPNIQYDSGPSIAYGPEAGGREPLLAMGTSGFEPFDILTGMGGIGRSVEPSSRVRSGPVLLPSCGSDRLVSDDAGDYAAHWSTNTSSGETTLSGVNPNIGPIQQARAPVNINSASLDVLTAVFLNVRGLYMVKSPNQYHTHTGSGWTAPATPLNTNYAVGIDLNTAQKIAKQIMTWRMNLARLPGDPTITPPNAPDSLSVPYPPGRRFGFACWEDFNTFVDNALSMALYGQTAAQIRQLYASSPATYAQRLAMLSLVKGHANPNSTLNKFNPDRTLGSAYADLDKGDIKQWTTELCFQSGGYFEIESVGRVLAPAEWVGGQNVGGQVLAECKIRAGLKLYDIQRITTQSEFFPSSGPGISTSIRSYPEKISDVGSPGAARYDGYISMATVEDAGTDACSSSFSPVLPVGGNGTSFFAHFTGATSGSDTDFGPDAYGFVESGVSVISGGSGGGSPTPGAQSDLFVDGVFSHETRRYPNYGTQKLYGAPGTFPNQDEYLRYRNTGTVGPKIKMDAGTLEMWVKPTWGAGIFSTVTTTDVNNPAVESSKVFFSTGEGKLGTDYGGALGPKDQSVSDNRIIVWASALDDGQLYINAMHATRINNEWGNWCTPDYADPIQHKDLMGYWGVYFTNGVRFVRDTNWLSANPKNWEYPGLWHHIAFVWWNWTTSKLIVDGRGEDLATPRIGKRSPNASSFQSSWSLFIGSNRFKERSTNGYPCNADCTIDALKIYPGDTGYGTGSPPHRYRSSATYQGVVGPMATAGGQPTDCRLLNLSWTAYYPQMESQRSALRFKLTGTGPNGAWTWQQGETNPAGPAWLPQPQLVPYVPPANWNATNPEPPESGISGRGIRLPDYTASKSSEIRVQVDFTQSLAGSQWIVAAPIVDDITLTTIPSGGGGKYLYYAFD